MTSILVGAAFDLAKTWGSFGLDLLTRRVADEAEAKKLFLEKVDETQRITAAALSEIDAAREEGERLAEEIRKQHGG